MDSFPKYVTAFYDDLTQQHWFHCRPCGLISRSYFSDINMRMAAREHARTCPAKEDTYAIRS